MTSLNYKRPPKDADIKAEISFLSEEKGGRAKPAFNGYRPDHNFGVEGMLNCAQHEYFEAEFVESGETANALLWFLAPELQENRLYIGKEFTVQEGARVVGNGKITQVINKKLIKKQQK